MVKRLLSLFMLLIIVSCSNNGTAIEQPEDIAMVGNKPPNAMIQIENEIYETVLGTYCWSTKNESKCVDTIGPVEILEGKKPIPVKPRDVIKLVMDYEPLPNKFHATQIREDEQTEVELIGNAFNAPIEKGIYYYHFGVWWMDEKVENLSHGDAFYNFVIEVS